MTKIIDMDGNLIDDLDTLNDPYLFEVGTEVKTKENAVRITLAKTFVPREIQAEIDQNISDISGHFHEKLEIT